ncbi:MAG: hypothetical protein ACK5ZG_04940 [Phycisphaerae bacterium]|jgi:hypothetical protein
MQVGVLFHEQSGDAFARAAACLDAEKTHDMPRAGVVLLAAMAASTGAAQAEVIEVTTTADNHYAIYADNGGVLTYIGGNELGRDGNPGQFNWSLPEHWSFTATPALYVAAWSDDSTTRGLLGNVSIGEVDCSTRNANWRV